MTAEIIQFDNYLRRKRATGKALADEALAEAALPGAIKEVPLTTETWYNLKMLQQIQCKRDQLNQIEPLVSHQTWEQVHASMDKLTTRLNLYAALRDAPTFNK